MCTSYKMIKKQVNRCQWKKTSGSYVCQYLKVKSHKCFFPATEEDSKIILSFLIMLDSTMNYYDPMLRYRNVDKV